MTIDGAGTWWRHAVIYQVYPRSFADGNGDGDGDIAGIRARLQYLAELGVDGIWISPWYPSPMADGGYDVSDFTGIHPMFGTIEQAGALISEAHEAGLRVLVDIVPNHTSNEHPWFQAALAAAPWLTGTWPLSLPGRQRSERRRAAQQLDQLLRWFGLGAGDRGRRPARAVLHAHVRTGAAGSGLDQ